MSANNVVTDENNNHNDSDDDHPDIESILLNSEIDSNSNDEKMRMYSSIYNHNSSDDENSNSDDDNAVEEEDEEEEEEYGAYYEAVVDADDADGGIDYANEALSSLDADYYSTVNAPIIKPYYIIDEEKPWPVATTPTATGSASTKLSKGKAIDTDSTMEKQINNTTKQEDKMSSQNKQVPSIAPLTKDKIDTIKSIMGGIKITLRPRTELMIDEILKQNMKVGDEI